MNKIVPNTAYTHGGKFHADDVFSTALLRILNPDIKVVRGFNPPEDFKGIVYDIGMGEYDHHSTDRLARENGVLYAAFGLLWKDFGTQCLIESEARRFDERFIQPLDLDDNTGCGHPIADIIASFNPSWDSTLTADECFEKAVDMAKIILENRFDESKAIYRARKMVLGAYKNSKDGIVILKKYAPWKPALKTTDADFVIYPSQRGGYGAQSVPFKNSPEGKAKYDFPESWAGLSDEELQNASGIASLRFCHAGRFMITGDDLDDMIAACELTRDLQGEPNCY